ncbi:hypothetical protein TWF481_011202 [Arthrobotrys musiformis]|uniref:Uncharacterized protein n=1 Tax=Arthrobotrys musiformis TaxID=47236 RepID=A0AAV9W0L0_9PEZI
MNPNSNQDDKRPIYYVSGQARPYTQRPVDHQSRIQTPVPQLANSDQASASRSRLSSPASQGTNTTRFYNPPSIASPLPQEFKDRWKVVDTSASSGASNSDRITSIEHSLRSPALKRKYEAIATTGNNNILRNGSAVKVGTGTSHAQPAPIAPGPGSTNRFASNPPQLPVRRETTTKSPSVSTSPSPAPFFVATSILDSRQSTLDPKDKHSLSGTHPNTQTITSPGTSQQTSRPSPQKSNTFPSNTSRGSHRGSAINQNGDGLINGLSGPSSLGREKDPIMPFWPLPQDDYRVGVPTVPQETLVQKLYERGAKSVQTEQKYSEEGSKTQDDESDWDTDCFEEYDPFDDVSELREALAKQERTRNKDRLLISDGSKQNPPKKSFKPQFDGSERPYLSSETRSYFQDENIPFLDSMVGHRLHISFSEQEAIKVWHKAYIICLDFAKEDFSIAVGIKAFKEFVASSESSRREKYETFLSIISEAVLDLPARNEEDVRRYMVEVLTSRDNPLSPPREVRIVPKKRPDSELSWPSLILALQCTEGMLARRHLASHAHVESIGSRKALRFLQPFRTFTEGSSDVVDCAWDSSGQNFALACTTYNDMYNRVGNLMLGDVEGPIKFLCGHKTLRPPNQGNPAILDPYLHSTVSSVDFSGDLLFSSGFDKTVKIWDKKDKLLKGSLDFEASILRMKMSGLFQNTGAVCLQNGQVVIFRSEEPGSRHSISARQDFLEPASVLWVNRPGARKGWVFVGYENKESDRRHFNASLGDLRLFDAESGTEVQEVRPGSTRQFDINLDESGAFLITGAIVGAARGPTLDTHSFVRVYDIERSPRKVAEFSCQHKDINKVTISPCRRYVTSSGTNGKSYLWDVRGGADPLHELVHGESRTPFSPDRDREEVDTGVTFASWAANGLFVTGSSDGIVKVWDPANADPFLYDLATFDDPVMTGAFSPDGDCLMIGETTGKATLLSYMGRHGPPGPFVQDRTMLAPIASEA